MFAANELGVWKKYGLNVTLVTFNGGAGSLLSAMAAGQYQIADSPVASVLPAMGGGATVKIFGSMWLDDGWTISVPANSSIVSPNQLKGSKIPIAISNVGSGTWQAAKLEMNAYNLTEKTDYVLVSTGTVPAMIASLKQGKTSALSLTFPATLSGVTAKPSIPVRFIINASDIYPKPWVDEVFVASNQFIQQHSDVLAAFLRGFLDAVNYFKSNHQWATTFIQKYYSVNSTLAEGLYAFTVTRLPTSTAYNSAALQNAIKLSLAAGIISSDTKLPDISQAYTNIPLS